MMFFNVAVMKTSEIKTAFQNAKKAAISIWAIGFNSKNTIVIVEFRNTFYIQQNVRKTDPKRVSQN